MIRGPITALAILFVLAGAMLLAGPAFGFSTMGADRGVSVSPGDSPENSLLGVYDQTTDETIQINSYDNEPSTVYYLDDTADKFDSLELENYAFKGGQTGLDVSIEAADESEHDYAIRVSCGDSVQNSPGELSVALVATGALTVELEDTTTNDITVNCRWRGGGDGFESSNASDVSGTSQEFSFKPDGFLDPEANVEIELQTWNGLEYSGATVTEVSGETSSDVGDANFTDDSTIVFDPDNIGNQVITITVAGIEPGEPWSGGNAVFTRTDTGVSEWEGFENSG